MSIIDALESLHCCCQVPRDAAIELAAKDARIAELEAELEKADYQVDSKAAAIRELLAEITNLKGLLREVQANVRSADLMYDGLDERIEAALTDKGDAS